jgi:glycosyltransferase involved in cell wall biosynthesis
MKGKNVLLTIHDCRYVDRKKGFAQKMVTWLYLKAPVQKAAWVTAVSENTKKEIMRYTGCAPGKIKVIPVPVNPVFKPAPKVFNKECAVILQVGAAENKNLARLAKAIQNMPCRLVIIGCVSPRDMEKLDQYKINYTIKSDLNISALYTEYVQCDIVSFVSLQEGFGMPLIEANCVERVVITSNISSMPEVAADAACLVDPYDAEDIAKGFLKIIHNEAYRQQLIANGRQNRLRFNEETIANAYYEMYKNMAQEL